MNSGPAKHESHKRAEGGAEPLFVLTIMLCSIAAFAVFVTYLCGFAQMSAINRTFYVLVLTGLLYCSLSYQINRLGAARREAAPEPAGRNLSYLFAETAPAVTVLVPSYREEQRVVMMTVLSAALAQYSNRRIVLLVDDPPGDRAALDRTFSALAEVQQLLAEPMARYRAELAAWNTRLAADEVILGEETGRLASSYRHAATWLDGVAASLEAGAAAEFAHVERFFIDRIVRELAADYRRHAEGLFEKPLDVLTVAAEYRRLGSLFCTEITSFERKRFANLSHAPNKAMNLNSYIGLLGGSFRIWETAGARFIEPSPARDADLVVPGTDYLLTLDADSVIRSSYISRLVDILEHNPAMGVAQTPYLTFPESTAPVERIAGATTDVQYLVHQGTTLFSASHWVGANALIRHAALRTIARRQTNGQHEYQVFIQDETVIEDTGSTVDLLQAGWSVYNHFAPLAYSATPADFGALAIQRKRWSNGGLIILPMLLRQYFGSARRLARLLELALRGHYLLSPLIGNSAVFLLMIWASVDRRTLVWTPLTMLPYFFLYGRDLSRLGYRFRDVFAVCSLNLMLLPVGLAGVAASVRQILTGRKASFSRTPKVADRTFIPPQYFLFNLAMAVLMLWYLVQGIREQDYVGDIIPALNACLYTYGLTRFIGIRNGFSDLRLLLADKLRLPPMLARAPSYDGWALRRSALAPLVFAIAVMVPLRVGPSLIEGDLARGAFDQLPRSTPASTPSNIGIAGSRPLFGVPFDLSPGRAAGLDRNATAPIAPGAFDQTGFLLASQVDGKRSKFLLNIDAEHRIVKDMPAGY